MKKCSLEQSVLAIVVILIVLLLINNFASKPANERADMSAVELAGESQKGLFEK